MKVILELRLEYSNCFVLCFLDQFFLSTNVRLLFLSVYRHFNVFPLIVHNLHIISFYFCVWLHLFTLHMTLTFVQFYS